MPATITSTEIFSDSRVQNIQVGAGDERKPIERLRRVELWRLADMFDIPYPDGATKDHMLLLMQGAQASGVDFARPPQKRTAPVEVPKVGELRKMVKARGGTWAPRDTAEVLMQKLAALDG